MTEQDLIALLVDLHGDMEHLAPSDDAATLRAFDSCLDLPSRPSILDIGCGAGAQTMTLVKNRDCMVTATDLIPAFLDTLRTRLKSTGLTSRVQITQADMTNLPFAERTFDLIWSEGAAYSMGFDAALDQWPPLLKPGGSMVVSELCWFSSNPPPAPKEFWAENYPGMRTEAENIAAIQQRKGNVIEIFRLPKEAWTQGYYDLLKPRLSQFRTKHAGNETARAVADMTAQEMAMIEAYSDVYGYTFFVVQFPPQDDV